MLTKWLHRAGVQRGDVWVGNLIQCWLPKGYKGGRPWGSTDPTKEMIDHCWRTHVGPEVRALRELKFLVPVGKPAREFFLGSVYGERYCGTFNLREIPK